MTRNNLCVIFLIAGVGLVLVAYLLVPTTHVLQNAYIGASGMVLLFGGVSGLVRSAPKH